MIRRPTYPALLLLPLVVLALAAWAPAVRDGTQVAPFPPTRHQEWRSYPVGGFILINPALPDSAGALRLPPDAVLEVPYWVGDDPD